MFSIFRAHIPMTGYRPWSAKKDPARRLHAGGHSWCTEEQLPQGGRGALQKNYVYDFFQPWNFAFCKSPVPSPSDVQITVFRAVLYLPNHRIGHYTFLAITGERLEEKGTIFPMNGLKVKWGRLGGNMIGILHKDWSCWLNKVDWHQNEVLIGADVT